MHKTQIRIIISLVGLILMVISHSEGSAIVKQADNNENYMSKELEQNDNNRISIPMRRRRQAENGGLQQLFNPKPKPSIDSPAFASQLQQTLSQQQSPMNTLLTNTQAMFNPLTEVMKSGQQSTERLAYTAIERIPKFNVGNS